MFRLIAILSAVILVTGCASKSTNFQKAGEGWTYQQREVEGGAPGDGASKSYTFYPPIITNEKSYYLGDDVFNVDLNCSENDDDSDMVEFLIGPTELDSEFNVHGFYKNSGEVHKSDRIKPDEYSVTVKRSEIYGQHMYFIHKSESQKIPLNVLTKLWEKSDYERWFFAGVSFKDEDQSDFVQTQREKDWDRLEGLYYQPTPKLAKTMKSLCNGNAESNQSND